MAASKQHCSGGYVVDVINESDKKRFDCMLCLSIIKKATHGCTKHVFCFDCLQEYIKSNDRKEIQYCPAGCQKKFNINELSSNDPYDQLINQIECKCSFCKWKGELLDFIQVHEGKCEEKLIPCHLCSISIKRKHMNHHLKNVCTHRPVACRGCRKNFPFINHLKHEESCGDIKVQCSFTNFGCNVEETRRIMITHENNFNKQHLSLIAKYCTDENKQLKEETKQLKVETMQLKDETKQLKEENNRLKEETTQLKEETTLLKEENKEFKEETKQLKEVTTLLKEENKEFKEENKQIKEKVELLEMNIRVLTWKDNFTQILLKEPANEFFHFPAVDEVHIKNIPLLEPNGVCNCFNKNNFTELIERMASQCNVLNNFKQELHELFSTTKTIRLSSRIYTQLYLFQIEYFKDYKCEDFSLKKDGNIFYIEKYIFHLHRMTFFISKWEIHINKDMTKIDIMKPDERFEVSPLPYLSSKYFSVWY